MSLLRSDILTTHSITQGTSVLHAITFPFRIKLTHKLSFLQVVYRGVYKKKKNLAIQKPEMIFFCHIAIPVGFCQPILIFFLKSYRNRKYNLGLTFAKLAVQAALQAAGMQRQNARYLEILSGFFFRLRL